MDKIYSRKRIKIKKAYNKKKMLVIVVVIVAILTFYNIYNSIDPVFETICLEKAGQIATNIMNEESSKVLEKIDYSDIITIMKGENNNNVLKTNIVEINKIASEIAIRIQNRLDNLKGEKIQIPIGSMTNVKYLAGVGPFIGIDILPVGTVETEIKNEFESKGINQTIYRIYLELSCNINIVTQYKNINQKTANQVLLVETVIMGDVPTTYYNLEGLDKNNVVDIIE